MNNAHITSDRPLDTSLLRDVVAVCPLSDARTSALALIDSLPTTIAGAKSLKAWMQAHDGQTIETVQVQHGKPWAPGPRKVDAARATYVELNGSRRDYAGTRVIASDAASIVVSGPHAVIAFVV